MQPIHFLRRTSRGKNVSTTFMETLPMTMKNAFTNVGIALSPLLMRQETCLWMRGLQKLMKGIQNRKWASAMPPHLMGSSGISRNWDSLSMRTTLTTTFYPEESMEVGSLRTIWNPIYFNNAAKRSTSFFLSSSGSFFADFGDTGFFFNSSDISKDLMRLD